MADPMIDIDTLKAGQELDLLVGKMVMGWDWIDKVSWMEIEGRGLVCTYAPWDIWHGNCPHINKELPAYSTEIAAAWKVVEKLDLLKWDFTLSREFDSTITGYVGLWVIQEIEGDLRHIVSKAKTAPLAICKAALKAVGA
jgi:hypothetical protein